MVRRQCSSMDSAWGLSQISRKQVLSAQGGLTWEGEKRRNPLTSGRPALLISQDFISHVQLAVTEGEINQSTKNMIRVTKLGPKRADLKLRLGFGEGAESSKPPLVLQKSHQPADVTLDIVGGLDHGIWDGIRQNPKSTRRKPHI